MLARLASKARVERIFPPWLQPQGGDVVLDVLVSPRAARTRIMGVHDGRLKIQLAAPPHDGQANDALVRFLGEALRIPRAQINITAGASNRRKTVRLAAVGVQRVLLALSPPSGDS